MIGNALEDMETAVFESQIGAKHEFLDGAGHEDLSGSSSCCDTCSDVHGDSSDTVWTAFHLTAVDTGSDLEPEKRERVADRLCGSDGARRAIEGGEEAVACGVDLDTVEAR